VTRKTLGLCLDLIVSPLSSQREHRVFAREEQTLLGQGIGT
jgi:hypothetical protein